MSAFARAYRAIGLHELDRDTGLAKQARELLCLVCHPAGRRRERPDKQYRARRRGSRRRGLVRRWCTDRIHTVARPSCANRLRINSLPRRSALHVRHEFKNTILRLGRLAQAHEGGKVSAMNPAWASAGWPDHLPTLLIWRSAIQFRKVYIPCHLNLRDGARG